MPGGEVELAIVMHTASGWHGYWLNPGDAGLPMKIEWRLPQGPSLAPLRFPVPDRLLVAGIVNYVYERDHAILTRLKVPLQAPGRAADPGEGAMACLHRQGLRPRARRVFARLAGRHRRSDRAGTLRRVAPRVAAPARQPGEFAR